MPIRTEVSRSPRRVVSAPSAGKIDETTETASVAMPCGGVLVPSDIDLPPSLDAAWQRKLWDKSSKDFDYTLPTEMANGSDDWLPTPHGFTLQEALFDSRFGLSGALKDKDVLELGAGVANHSVLIYRCQPRGLTMTEITDDRLNTSRQIMEHNACSTNTDYVTADWLAVPPSKYSPADGLYDVVITNPPFCMSGKQNRRYFIDELILNTHKVLRPGGSLMFIQSSMADLAKTLARLDENGFDATIVHQRCYPWRDYYWKDALFVAEAERIKGEHPGFLVATDGRRIETLTVLKATLREYKPYYSH